MTSGSRLRPFVSAMTFAYPLIIHLAIVADRLSLATSALLLLALLHGLLVLRLPDRRPLHLLPPLLLAALALTALVRGEAFALYLPPILIAAALLYLFGQTLLPGREALISRFARIVMDDRDPRTPAYTRAVTWLWSGFFALLLLADIGLALFAPLETWSLFSNILNYLFLAALGLLEYLVRLLYFRRRPDPGRLRNLFDRQRMQRWMAG